MKTFTIKRISKRSDGVFGVMLDGDIPFCLTLERPWLNNEKEVSSIPPGEYVADSAIFKSRYESFLLRDVPGRTGIFVHKGNWITDSLGCILLGEQFAVMQNPHDNNAPENSVASTGEAFTEFMQRAAGEKVIRLVIVEV